MSFAPWRSPLARALHRNRSQPYSRYFQLATVRADGRPANRTVVFRGFLEESDRLKFVTDARSEKVEHSHHQPWAEACWYFTKTREQFRIGGVLTVIGNQHPDPALATARWIAWQALSDAARLQFTWPYPGKPRAPQEAFLAGELPDPTHPLPHFCLVFLEPKYVDHLELQGDPQNRYRYEWHDGEGWGIESINP